MAVREEAILELVRWVTPRLEACAITEQIKVYGLISELLPTEQQRAAAKEIAQGLSRAASLQLDFTRTLFAGNQASFEADGQ